MTSKTSVQFAFIIVLRLNVEKSGDNISGIVKKAIRWWISGLLKIRYFITRCFGPTNVFLRWLPPQSSRNPWHTVATKNEGCKSAYKRHCEDVCQSQQGACYSRKGRISATAATPTPNPRAFALFHRPSSKPQNINLSARAPFFLIKMLCYKLIKGSRHRHIFCGHYHPFSSPYTQSAILFSGYLTS